MLKGALALVTSAIVGVIADLATWFALQVLFHKLHPFNFGPISLNLPVIASFDWHAGLITAASGRAIVATRKPIIPVLALAALAGYLLTLAP